jgi:hypothetical protein
MRGLIVPLLIALRANDRGLGTALTKEGCRWPCGAILRVASICTTSASTSLRPAEGDAASPILTVDGSASSGTDTADPATFGPKPCVRGRV